MLEQSVKQNIRVRFLDLLLSRDTVNFVWENISLCIETNSLLKFYDTLRRAQFATENVEYKWRQESFRSSFARNFYGL